MKQTNVYGSHEKKRKVGRKFLDPECEKPGERGTGGAMFSAARDEGEPENWSTFGEGRKK